MIEADYSQAWCVEEREIARLKECGRGASKKLRRQYGRAIRYWQHRLRRARSISIPIVFGRARLRKYGRAMDITYEVAPGTSVYLLSADGQPPLKLGVTGRE